MEELTQATAPAFPHTWEEYRPDGGVATITTHGLTKREYFAGLAMQSMVSSPEFNSVVSSEVAKYAVTYADALLLELSK